MNMTIPSFPTYRKYTGINVWFKIIDEKNFIEVKQVGVRFLSHEVHALQYPEMVFIQDMLSCLEERWIETTAAEFNQAFAQAIT